MKIPFSTPSRKICTISCPSCHSTKCWRHGSYTRKWFHFCHPSKFIIRQVQRYYCTCKSCTRRTFTVQAPDVLPYCRFFVSDLYEIDQRLEPTPRIRALARLLKLHRGVVRRVVSLIERSKAFFQALCRENTNGEQCSGLQCCMETAQIRYCWITLRGFWFRHIYRVVI